MNKKPVLVVMAAGMGSRYGGLKQIDPVGVAGEAILDFSLFDAYNAGFETAVIIIKEAIKDDFMDMVGNRLKACPMEIRYAYQELDKLPEGYSVPEGRTKPWGTSHAILCAREAIDGAPFAVVNADDYYGQDAYKVIYDFLANNEEGEKFSFCMVGYELGKTVTENGHVARGVCVTSEDGYLTDITERTKIEKYDGGIHFTEDDGKTWTDLAEDTTVSMNLWGFTEGFIDEAEATFPAFLDATLSGNGAKAEFFLPSTVSKLLGEDRATVKVLHSADKWYGVTYAADKPVVVEALKEMTAKGLYPAAGLWNK